MPHATLFNKFNVSDPIKKCSLFSTAIRFVTKISIESIRLIDVETRKMIWIAVQNFIEVLFSVNKNEI